MTLALNGIAIEVREDQYINATQLCKAGGKKFHDWYRLDTTKELISALGEILQTEEGWDLTKPLVDIKKGGNNKTILQGSWVHPDLAVQLAQWISPKFAIQVSRWVNEWRKISHNNEHRFQKALSEIEPSKRTMQEKLVQEKLLSELGGKTEVDSSSGIIDLLTHDKIIEIKSANKWKHAIGQILSYSLDFPNHNKCIYLFGESHDKHIIQKVCSKYEIEVVFYDYKSY